MKFDFSKLSALVLAFNDYAASTCPPVGGQEFKPFKLMSDGDEQRIYFLTIVLWTSTENIPFVVGLEMLRQHLECDATLLCSGIGLIRFQ